MGTGAVVVVVEVEQVVETFGVLVCDCAWTQCIQRKGLNGERWR